MKRIRIERPPYRSKRLLFFHERYHSRTAPIAQRGVPYGFVPIIFWAHLRGERYSFPLGEILDFNRSFSTTIYPQTLDHGKWNQTLHALPKSDAEKPVLNSKDAAAKVKAGRKEDNPPFAPALIEKAIKGGEVEYELKAR